MSYGLVDDELFLNRKVKGFTSDEFRLWMMTISFSRKHKTRGYLTEADVLDVAQGQRIRRPGAVIAGLTLKRGFDKAEGGYRIHDWDDMPYDRLSERGKRAGKASGEARREHVVQQDADITRTKDEPRAGTPRPSPSPSPVLSKDLSTEDGLTAYVHRRGVSSTSVTGRLAELKQQLEAKGIKYWVRYVTKAPEAGRTCLIDRRISEWLEEDYGEVKATERENPGVLDLTLREMPA